MNTHIGMYSRITKMMKWALYSEYCGILYIQYSGIPLYIKMKQESNLDAGVLK